MENTGWRLPSVSLIDAAKLADVGKELELPKSQCVTAFKRVEVNLGLKNSHYKLLDTLFSHSQPKDWEKGQRPVVWPSNATLMQETGQSLSALKRGLNRIAEVGLVSFCNSPNGHRRGRRDKNGRIVEACGIDLSPIAARNQEFEEIYQEIKAENDLCNRYLREIKVARREIRAMLAAATERRLAGPWKNMLDLFTALLEKLPLKKEGSGIIAKALGLFRDLLARVKEAFCAAYSAEAPADPAENPVAEDKNAQKMDAKEPRNEPDILTTNQPTNVQSKDGEKTQDEEPRDKPKPLTKTKSQEKWGKDEKTPEKDLKLPTVMQACPLFTGWARDLCGYLYSWADFYNAACKLRPIAGISENAWDDAQNRLGKPHAALAFALIFDKHAAGEVASPGGYLRGMIEKAENNGLNLERSIYGRLSKKFDRATTR